MNIQSPHYCEYYQAIVDRQKTWFFTAILRSFEHVVFDRTLDGDTGLFEFFVPVDQEEFFLQIIRAFEQLGVVTELKKLPNRFMQ